MKISVIRATELDTSALAKWRALQQSNPALVSPYFCPEFTLVVAAVRDDVRIAVLEDDHSVVGFFPFQSQWTKGVPVGGIFSDHHGVIAAPDTRWDWTQLLQATGLAYWKFDHLTAGQTPQVPQVALKHEVSPALDLSEGFAAYKARRNEAGVRSIEKLNRLRRNLAQELGPLRFEAHSNDPAVFESVIRLKVQQYSRTRVPNVFAAPWTRALVERIWNTDLPEFAGRLSALYAGETLVAAHLGMCSKRVWHWWFPVYQPDHARYSPGSQLLMLVAEAAAARGHRILDLGKGGESFKKSFADCSLPLVEGCVMRPAPATTALQLQLQTKHWLRTSPVVQPLKPLLRRVRSFVNA